MDRTFKYTFSRQGLVDDEVSEANFYSNDNNKGCTMTVSDSDNTQDQLDVYNLFTLFVMMHRQVGPFCWQHTNRATQLPREGVGWRGYDVT